jgi:hypothetical protein
MVVVPLSQPIPEGQNRSQNAQDEPLNWARMAAGGTLLVSALLLLTGHRKAGLASAAAGTTLALLDQQSVVKSLWNALPGYVDDAQHMIGKVEESVIELSNQRDRLHKILNK